MMGKIFAIKRFAVHDGDGIRTTVFFKGCPLRCVWCHNPESLSFSPQLAFYAHKCVGCGECMPCPRDAIAVVDGKTETRRDLCVSCGQCADQCAFSAREIFGKEIDALDLAEKLCEDKAFFESSGGGVTLSGGECLSQPDFALELLKLLKERGIHTAVDTCGYAPWSVFEKIMPYVDTFLYDIKAIDPEVHKRCTGRENGIILTNFERLCDNGCEVEVRIPYVVGFNDGEIDKIGRFLRGKAVKKVTVLQYHDLARSKYAAVALRDTMPENLTDGDRLSRAVKLLIALGIPAISGNDD